MRASKSCLVIQYQTLVASDASGIGNYMYNLSMLNEEGVLDVLARRVFSEEEKKQSSTYRELSAFADFYLSERALSFKNQNILHFTDSENCSRILTVGSKNPRLHFMVRAIILKCQELGIKLTVDHVVRSDPRIILADEGSRIFDLSDFSLDFDNFLLISKFWGPFVLDCFASRSNKKCDLFVSKFEDPTAWGVNFFAQRLPSVALWVMPPPKLIVATLWHLAKYKSFGCLVVPAWPSSTFWTLICKDGRHYNDYVKEIYKFKPVYHSGPDVLSGVFKGVKPFFTLALRFDFRFATPDFFTVSQFVQPRCFLDGCSICT